MGATNPDAINTVNISAQTGSKIIKVSLYSGRAEITRTCSFSVKPGQNQVHISGLPNVLDSQSLRVEGRGNATIHDVTLSRISAPSAPQSSPKLIELEEERDLAKKSLDRCKKSLAALETFINTMNVQHIEATSLTGVVDNYDTAGEKLDKKIMALEKKLKVTEAAIDEEKKNLKQPADSDYNELLAQRVSVGVVTEEEGQVELVIMYALYNCNWKALYDIRVVMKEKEKPATLVYKAGISQSTGESWENVPITLETAAPTFGVEVPTLQSWTLSVRRPPPPPPRERTRMMRRSPKRSRSSRSVGASEESDDDMGFGLFDDGPRGMNHLGSYVNSKGNVSATYRIPGVVTIPSDGSERTFTIVELHLDASMSWVSVPKVDARTHLKAKIKNSSEYTLLPGGASVYVDGSFISRTTLASVSPQEVFDCPLGLDPTVRITYHPQSKKKSQTGFYNKSSVHVYSQRITIHNTKAEYIVENLKILEQIPISEDEQITVKLVKPALSLPGLMTGTMKTKDSAAAAARRVPHANVEDGVLAQWDGSDDSDTDVSSLGKDGKINFLCTVPAQGKLNLLLQWEVSSSAKVIIDGL